MLTEMVYLREQGKAVKRAFAYNPSIDIVSGLLVTDANDNILYLLTLRFKLLAKRRYYGLI